MEREKVGKVSSDLLLKKPDTLSPIEQMEENLTDYDRNLFECIDRFKKQFTHNFFVVVITKKERLMPNVLRNYFTARISCPTPDYDQTVYHYRRKEEDVVFLWTIPAKDICEHLRHNALQVDKAERQLLNFVLGFYDKSLLALAKKLNNEEEDSPLLQTL